MKQITAKQYPKIRPLLPVQRGNVRISNIDFINAVLYVLENGCKWRALPERFGKWQTVYARFRRWFSSGVLERLFAALREQEAVGEDADCFDLDGASAEVHPDGTGARKTNGPQSIGKSRGGWYAKIPMVSASPRQAMIFRLSDGQSPALLPASANCSSYIIPYLHNWSTCNHLAKVKHPMRYRRLSAACAFKKNIQLK